MPGKSGQVIFGILVAEVVQEQERIEILGFAEAKSALELDSGALDGGLWLGDLSNGT
jgi:hypothetical protein